MPADLHVHSNCSDGNESPEEVVQKAKKAKLNTISLTDHDTLEGVPRAIAEGEMIGLSIIPGIEFSTEIETTEVHILGYYLDSNNDELNHVLGKIQNARKDRIFKISAKLKELGVNVDPEKVLRKAGNKSPGRPHVAQVMMDEKIVSSFNEAFQRFIDFKGPAYVPHYKLEPKECIELIKRVGGIAVFAHPAISKCDHLIPVFVEAGLRGIEAHYPTQNGNVARKYIEIAKKHSLLITGGSDYHGLNSGRKIELGKFVIKDDLVEGLKNEHIRRN